MFPSGRKSDFLVQEQELVNDLWCHVCATHLGERTYNLSCAISRQKSDITDWEDGECESTNPLMESAYRSGAGPREVFALSRLFKKVMSRLPKGYIAFVYFANIEATPIFDWLQKKFNFLKVEYQGQNYLLLEDPREEEVRPVQRSASLVS